MGRLIELIIIATALTALITMSMIGGGLYAISQIQAVRPLEPPPCITVEGK